MNKRGGSREGAGRKSGPATATHPVRCTDEGWKWLQSQATGKGHTSVGKWADAKGRRASKRKGNDAGPVIETLDAATGYREE